MYYHYGGGRDVDGAAFEFDTKTNDMVLRLGSNYTNFDKFRSKLEGGDLEISKKEYKNVSIYEGTYERLQNYDSEDGMKEYAYNRYSSNTLAFSVSMRSNLKRHFKFWSEWEPYAPVKFVPDPVHPTKIGRYGREEANGRHVRDWDNVEISKTTARDEKWERKVLRHGVVYF